MSFQNDYLKEYDQTDWSVADEFCLPDELLISRSDFFLFKKVVSRLIRENDYRKALGDKCKIAINEKMRISPGKIQNTKAC